MANKKIIKIGVKVNGGFGTILVRANFLHCLYEYIDDAKLQIYAFGHISSEINYAIFEKQPSIFFYDVEKKWKKFESDKETKENFALLFELDIYPKVIYTSKSLTASSKLCELVEAWKKFRSDVKNELYFRDLRRSKPYEYSKLIIENKHILNSADLNGVLEVGREYRMPIKIFQDENEVLGKFRLSGKKYITLQRGINPKLGTVENNKLWPIKYFNELIRQIKFRFPEFVMVQLGESVEHCVALEGIDMDLLGKTSWDDIKILLKHAVLHIDGECGMVHLRKALHAGPSLVFFGPTPVELFGYDGNFNMFSETCSHWCAELRDDWEYHCLKDVEEAPCIYSVTPDMAMKTIEGYLQTGSIDHIYELAAGSSLTQTILDIYGEQLDSTYVEEWFKQYKIADYEVIDFPVSKLMATVYDGSKWNTVPISETPAYKFLEGDESAYEENIRKRNRLSDNTHSIERFRRLIDSVNKKGFERMLVVVKAENVFKIDDGQHRAALWMHQYGTDSTIPAIVIYK